MWVCIYASRESICLRVRMTVCIAQERSKQSLKSHLEIRTVRKNQKGTEEEWSVL